MRRSAEEFERVIVPYSRTLLRFAHRLTRDPSTAEDLVQETLLLAWRGFHQFESGTNARAWLFRILMNSFHGQSRRVGASVPVAELRSGIQAAGGSELEALELAQALDRLVPEQRTALVLAAVEGFTCREIAEILAVPIGTVMSRLSRAREAMREAMAPLGERCSEKVAR